MDKNNPTTSKGTRHSRDQYMLNAVFTNDMLVEEILKRAIVSNPGFPELVQNISKASKTSLSVSDVTTFRKVCKSWNYKIFKLFRKSHQPLFHLPLTHENTSGLLAVENGTCFEEREEKTLLSIFLSAMRQWGYDNGQSEAELDEDADQTSTTLPPFHLSLTPSFFRVANAPVYHALFDFLLKHAPESMTHFTFNFHRNRFDYIPTTFPDFDFPRLTHINLVIERMAWSFVPLIQKLLESAPNLHTLDFTSSSCIVTHSVPHLSDTIDSIARSRPYSLRLPSSIKRILLYGTPDSCSCFYRIPVDNLTQLETLALSASSCIVRQIDDMFQHLAARVKHVHFIGFTSCVYLNNRNFQLTFIPMPRVETLSITMPWEIRPGHGFRYSTHLPALKDLTLIHHGEADIFGRFMNSGRESLTVERCTMLCIQPHIHAENGSRTTSQRLDVTKLQLIQDVQNCFPNLSHLGIGVNAKYDKALEFIFSEMTTLKSLAIYVESNARFKTTICWDALFTGLSEVACKAMKENDLPGYWNAVCLLDDKFPSIRDLKNLEALYLVETSYPSCRAFSFGENGSGGSGHGLCNFEVDTLPPKGDHFFTNLSFHFSFFRMPKLRLLACTKGFMPSEQIQERWLHEKGLKIKNIRSPKLYHLLIGKFSLYENSWYND